MPQTALFTSEAIQRFQNGVTDDCRSGADHVDPADFVRSTQLVVLYGPPKSAAAGTAGSHGLPIGKCCGLRGTWHPGKEGKSYEKGRVRRPSGLIGSQKHTSGR